MTKSLKNLSVFDPNRDVLANWLIADPLHFAWLVYSPLEKQDRYRDSGSKPPAFGKSLQFEMQLELRDRVANGELIALGIQTLPIPKSITEQIAKPFFAVSSVDIDWDHDRISGLGLEFHDVRLSFANGPNSNQSESIVSNPPIAKRGGGRPSRYPEATEILEILFRDDNYRKMRAAALLDPFNREFSKRFERPNRKIAPISERSLRDHLKLYRKELAETGRA